MPKKTVEIFAQSILQKSYIIYSILIIADLLVIFLKFYCGYDHVLGFVPLFDFDRERSIPALFTTLLFIYIAILFVVLAKTNKTQKLRLNLLGAIFIFCAIDEYCSIHERFSFPIQQLLNTSGVFYFGWVIPYSIIGLILIIYFIPLFASLPIMLNRWLACAFLVFFAGAVGVEMLGGYWYEQNGQIVDLLYSILVLFEESFEMLGLLICMQGLHKHIQKRFKAISLIL